MLTRAFLLFLAMVTGLSAAQAADGSRACHGAEVSATLAAFADDGEAEASVVGVPANLKSTIAVPGRDRLPVWRIATTPEHTTPTVRLSDRSRT
jgi:hypothetical protein